MIISLFMEETPLCCALHDGSTRTDEHQVRGKKRGQPEHEREPDAIDHEQHEKLNPKPKNPKPET
jgi:hypothetical protein